MRTRPAPLPLEYERYKHAFQVGRFALGGFVGFGLSAFLFAEKEPWAGGAIAVLSVGFLALAFFLYKTPPGR